MGEAMIHSSASAEKCRRGLRFGTHGLSLWHPHPHDDHQCDHHFVLWLCGTWTLFWMWGYPSEISSGWISVHGFITENPKVDVLGVAIYEETSGHDQFGLPHCGVTGV